jgi:PAS domain S-box-containing protein
MMTVLPTTWGKAVIVRIRARRVFVLGTVLASLLLGTFPRALAVDPDRRISQYGHTVWRIQDGTISPPTNIAQTTDGFLWVTTAQGLLRFDGVRFVPWQPPQGQNLPGTHFSAILGSRDGSLWIGTTRGLARWKDGQLRTYTDLEHPAGIAAIDEDDSGTIWVTRYGQYAREAPLCSISEETLRCFGKKDGIPVAFGQGMTHDSEGNIWFGSKVLVRWRPGTLATTYFGGIPELAKTDGINDVVLGPSGTAWASLAGTGPQFGIQYYSGGKWTSYAIPGFDGARVHSHALLVDHRGSLWVGTENDGLYRIYGGVADHYSMSDGLSGNGVGSLFEDREGNIWVTTDGGLDMFRDTVLISYTTRQGVSDRQFNSVMALSDGAVWIGTGGGLNILRKQEGKTAILDRKLSGKWVAPMLEDHSGRVWLEVDLALMRFQNGLFREILAPGGQRFASFGGVSGVAEDPGGTIWVLTNQKNQLFSIVGDKIKKQASLSDELGRQKLLVADRNGGVWLGTQLGKSTISYFRDGRFQTTSLSSPQGEAGIQALFVDSDNSLLVSSSQGLYRLNHGQLTLFSGDNGLPCPETFNAIRDNHGALWIYTRCGMVRITESEWAKWIENPHVAVSVMILDAPDGAQAGTGHHWQPTSSKAPDGRLWFVTGVSAQVLDPDHLYENALPPPIYVEGVVADRKRFDATSLVKVPALSRDLEIDYTAPSFSVPQKVRFRYMLEGRDREWQDAGTRRQAFYTDLKPGHYRFRVTACNGNGVWNQTGASLDFVVRPAYYQTNWFRFFCVAAFIALLWALHRWRVHQLKSQEKRLRDVVETIPAMTFTALSNGFCTSVNKRWTEYTGLSVENTSGAGWHRAIHPEDLVRHSEKWRISVATGQLFEDEARFRCAADGTYRWFLVRGVPLRDQHGNVVRWYGTLTDIEDRKRAEEARQLLSRDLQESKAKLEEAQRITHVGYWERDLATDRITWSDETYRIFGLQPQEDPIDLAALRQKIHPEDRELLSRALDEALGGGTRYDIEYRLLRPTGEVRIVHSNGDVKRDASGRPHKMFGTVQDITDRKRAEEALQESEKSFRLIVDGIAGLVAIMTAEGQVEFVNSQVLEYFGKTLEDLKGWSTSDAVHPDDLPNAVAAWMHSVETGDPYDVDHRLRRFDGAYRWFRSRGLSLRDAEGRIIRWYNLLTDIDDRKRWEEKLRRSEAYLSEAQKLSHTGSWAWHSADRRMGMHLSEEWYRIYGFDPAEGVPTWEEYLERVHPEDRLQWTGITERAIVEKADYDHEFRILLPNGMVKWIHTVGHPVLSNIGDLEGFVGSSTDITELKSAEQERQKLRQLEADLAHTNRVSTLGEMAASLAHEIKQPIAAAITSANSCIEWLAHEPPNLDRARAAAARIDRYGNRAAEIIDRIRSFYKKSPPQRELVDVNGIIHEMLTLLEGEAYRFSVAMRTNLSAELPKIMADRVQLQQVFMNLMLNATEAMKDAGGELTVKSELQDNQLQFSVSDTGVGLPMEKMDQIFSAFFTTKPQGSGMGLAISRSIVESHGGRLWATANDGRGATFHFTLPTEVTEPTPLVVSTGLDASRTI